MKAEELRIGNIVNDHDWGEMIVESILSGTLRVYLHTPDREYLADFALDSIHPIPLTPEWLERFGFKFIDMMFENVPMRYWRKDFMIVEESKVILLYNDKEVVTTVNVGYVHQLQNLYFALTAKELTLKP